MTAQHSSPWCVFSEEVRLYGGRMGESKSIRQLDVVDMSIEDFV